MSQLHSLPLRAHFASSTQGFADKGEVHSTLMVIGWVLLFNLGLWAQFFKEKKLSVTVHAGCMTLMMILVLLSGFFAAGTFGVKPSLHRILGIIIMVITFLAQGTGVFYHNNIVAPYVKPQIIRILKNVHRILGLVAFGLATFQLFLTYLKHQTFKGIIILLINAISCGLFYLLKKRAKRIQQSSMQLASNQNNNSLKLIRTNKQLELYKNDYIIFADKVYDINKVLNNHPGGWELIKEVQGRQIDRYFYGTEPLQKYSNNQMENHNHHASNLNMVGQPIAKLYNKCPYPSMQQINLATIQQIRKPTKHLAMHAVYLASKSIPFQYQGFTELAQLGKYYAVNINNTITRLYSIVNFLHASNLDLMAKLAGGEFWQNNKIIFYNHQVQEVMAKSGDINLNTIPLLIKNYEKGKFTTKFLSGKYTGEVKISSQRGRGMFLDELPPGVILMFAGGTGVNPFCDVIDVLFKQVLLAQRHPLSQQIAAQCPLSTQQLLSNFKFVLFISVHDLSQLHPITLYQCNLLGQRGRLTTFIKTADSSNVTQQYPGINQLNTRFNAILDKYISPSLSKNISQVYICGPPGFTKSIVNQFPKLQLEPSKYKIL